MLLMNVARLNTQWLPFLFFGLFGAMTLWISHNCFIPSINPTYLSVVQQRRLTLFALVVALLLAAARLPYLMEGHLHHLVGPVVYDDTWHFQEINSLVHSVRYPARCSLIPNRYFSLYYAPWMMIAAIYLAIPAHGFTIKAAFAIGCAIYQVLLCLTLLYIGTARARSVKHLYWAIYLIACWAGVESFFSAVYYLRRNPVWLLAPEMPIHFPSLFIGILWAPHHATAAVALLVCWHIWDRTQEKRWTLLFECSLLLAYAFYSSVFVFLGALPFAAYYALRTTRTNDRSMLAVACCSAILVWPLLWIYLGKSQDVHFLFPFMKGIDDLFPFVTTAQFTSMHPVLSALIGSFRGMAVGFVVFLVFIVLNFLLHAIALMLYGRKLSLDHIAFASIAILFILSTYFIGFPEGDNYASRGYMVPIVVLGWICAGILPEIRPKPWIMFGLLLGSFGLFHEGVSTFKHAIYIARTPLDAEYGMYVLRLNQDRHTRTVSSGVISPALADDPDLIYSIEKFVDGGKGHLVVADRQLECLGPHGPWKWQQVPMTPDKGLQ
ncbi:MAG: hypothetical protein ACLQMO_13185 [Acidobacteriaceae bacterium]